MNKQIFFLSIMLVAMTNMNFAIDNPTHFVGAPRTTAEFNQKPGIINQNCGTCSGSSVQTIGLQFSPLDVSNGAFIVQNPSQNGAVGPEQFVLNSIPQVRSFNKFTGQPDGILSVDSGTFLNACNSDTKLTFDRWGQRWFLTGDIIPFGSPSIPAIVLAWSDGPIITENTKWSAFQFFPSQIPPGGVDSPLIATDQNAVYISIDTYNFAFTEFLGVSSIVIPQSSFVPGNPFNFTVFSGLFNPTEFPQVGGLDFAPSPNNYDPHPQFGYIVVSSAINAPGYFTYTNYFMLRIIDPGSSSPSLFPSPANPISLAAPIFTDGTLIPHKGNLYGANGLLQNSSNLLNYPGTHVRNHQLYFVATGLVDKTGTGTLPQDGGDRNAILWYQYDLTGDPTGQGRGIETASTVPVLIQSGAIYDPTDTPTPLNYWNPAIMTDKCGNMVISGNVAGENNFIQAFYTGRKATDKPGMLRDIVLLTNNTKEYNFGTLNYTKPVGQRWGDYSGISPDPCNDRDIWVTSEIVSGQNRWGLLTTKLIPAH